MDCSQCSSDLKLGANFCPECGKRVFGNTKRLNRDSASGPMRFCFACILVVGFGFVLMSVLGTDSTAPPINPKKIAAFSACQRFVTQRLKAPSTADFPSFNDKSVTTGANVFTVESYVDAQNAFGAKMRTGFHCDVLSEDGENWRLYNLRLDK